MAIKSEELCPSVGSFYLYSIQWNIFVGTVPPLKPWGCVLAFMMCVKISYVAIVIKFLFWKYTSIKITFIKVTCTWGSTTLTDSNSFFLWLKSQLHKRTKIWCLAKYLVLFSPQAPFLGLRHASLMMLSLL